MDFKAGLSKVSPTPEAAKASASSHHLASAVAALPASQPSPSTDFKSQLKKTSKSCGLYGPIASAEPSEEVVAEGASSSGGGFLGGFKSQLRKVPRPSEEEVVSAQQPTQSDPFR